MRSARHAGDYRLAAPQGIDTDKFSMDDYGNLLRRFTTSRQLPRHYIEVTTLNGQSVYTTNTGLLKGKYRAVERLT